MSSELYKQRFIEQLEANYELRQQIRVLKSYNKCLHKVVKKLVKEKEKEEDKEPLPLNLTDIFDDTFHVNS